MTDVLDSAQQREQSHEVKFVEGGAAPEAATATPAEKATPAAATDAVDAAETGPVSGGGAAGAAGAKKDKERSFCQAILNEDDGMTMKLNIDQGCGSVGADLGKIITHYDRYAWTYNTDKAAFIRRYANTKRPLCELQFATDQLTCFA